MSRTRPQKRLNRKQASAYLEEKYGVILSRRTLEEKPIPYIVLEAQAMYLAADLDAYIDRQIAQAPRRMGARAKIADRAPALAEA
jgi:hypothetical protein